MEILFKTFLAIHIAGGTTALLAGAAAMLAPKGKRNHTLAGKTYYWSMAAVCASAVVMCFLHPQQFLLYVAIFSFYLCFTGERMTKRKKPSDTASLQDWIAAVLASLAGALMLVRGGTALFDGNSFGWVSVVFGALSLGFAVLDMTRFRKPSTDRMHWFFTHLTRMIGGYVATFTAFCVVNVKFLPKLAVWLLPTVIGSMGIAMWTAYYRRKFRRV